jgi:rhodanese-related sulfurtransferase
VTTKIIQANDLFAHADLNNLCLVDVRTPAEVRGDALETIIAMPLDQLDSQILKDLIEKQHPASKAVYLICQSGKRAQIAAEQLAGKIPQEIIVVEGGMKAIREAQGNQSPEKGVMSIERQVRLTAGALVVAGVLAGYLLHSGWFALSGLVGAGLVYAAITDTCAMGLVMAKAPWNR